MTQQNSVMSAPNFAEHAGLSATSPSSDNPNPTAPTPDISAAPATPTDTPTPQGQTAQPPTSSVPARVEKLPPRVETDDRGVLMPRDFEGMFRLANIYFKSGMVPKVFDSIEKVFLALQYCYELGLKPVTGMRQMCVVNGTVNIWGDMPLSLVMQSGKLESMQEFWFDDKGKEISRENDNLSADVFGFSFQAKRLNGPTVVRTFSRKEAQDAGLLGGKDTWKKYFKRMVQCRARAWALKDLFPDVLSGISIAEYDHDYIPGTEDQAGTASSTGSTQDRAASLNDKFGKKPDIETEGSVVS